MRRARFFLAASSLTAAGAALWASGCGSFYEKCTEDGECKPFRDAGAVTPACMGDPTVDPQLISEKCGVFVRGDPTDDDDGMGSPTQPFQTLGAAIGAVKDKWIFVCTKNSFTEAVKAGRDGLHIYGGFDCSTPTKWVWKMDTKTKLEGKVDQIALSVTGQSVIVKNFAIQAASATKEGGSSIAVLVHDASVEFDRCDLTAKDGAKGKSGTSPGDDPLLNGDPGAVGLDACGAGVSHRGGIGKTKQCPGGLTSIAGNGGDGGLFSGSTALPGGNGANGSPADPTRPAAGKGGLGEGLNTLSKCGPGEAGADGVPGDSGAGATSLGELTPEGYTGSKGSDGKPGKPGQGGGGGGGAKGALSTTCGAMVIDVPGASGGAGGTGGCQGALGGGGGSGGSSIALVSIDASIVLKDTTLTSGKGGTGGKGGDGQRAGSGGAGGDLGHGAGIAKDSCRGGGGGAGGKGGPGGGGQGGHSLAVAVKGGSVKGGIFKLDLQEKGVGGPGGAFNTTANSGQGGDGLTGQCWDFVSKKSCAL
jgi:hypothetical protein